MKNSKLTKLLFKSLDAPLTDKEKELLNSGLRESSRLREEKEYLLKIRGAVQDSAAESFEPFFEERLLNKLNRSVKAEKYFDSVSASLSFSFGRVAITAVIILIILISYNLNNGNNYSISSLLGNSKTNIATVFDPFENTIGTKLK